MATARCTWTAVSGVDGYNVYLKSNGTFVKQNSELIEGTVYDIENLEDGNYEAYATSVLNDVESEPSNTKGFVVYDFYTDFSEYTSDEAPNDWTRRWSTSGDGWIVRNQAGATGGKVLEFQNSSTGGRRALSWNELDTPDATDVEITMRFKGFASAGTNNQSDPRVLVRGSYPSSNENGYTHGFRWGTDDLRINAYKNGSFDSMNNISQNNDLEEWYFAKVRVEGNDHKAKVWKDGDTEPDWQNEAADSSSPITGDGWVGLFSFGFREYEIDWFGVNVL